MSNRNNESWCGTTGWFRLPHAVIARHGPELGALGVAVYACLAHHADREGVCWPSRCRIARELGLSERSVIQYIRVLERLGLIAVERSTDGRSSNTYRLLAVRATGAAGSPPRVQQVHPTGAAGSPPRVQQVHPTGAAGSPKQDPEDKTQRTRPNTPPTPQGGRSGRQNSGETAPTQDDGFAAFWASYPRQVNEAGARKAWNRLSPDQALQRVILEAVEAQRCSDQWTRDGGRYVPAPAKWLTERRWTDRLTPVKPAPPPEKVNTVSDLRKRLPEGPLPSRGRLETATLNGTPR